MSIGVVRSNSRLLICVPVTIIFRTVQARAEHRPGPAASIYVALAWRHSAGFIPACPQCHCDQAPREIIRRQRDGLCHGQFWNCPSCAIKLSTSTEGRTLHSAREWLFAT
jgi:hypothetical protein